MWGLCFSVRPWLPICLVGLVPLFLLLGQPRAWLLGWLHGFATWSVALFWLVDTLTTYGQIEGWLAGLLLLGLGAVLGLYHLIFAAIASRLWRRGGGVRLAALPALWVLLEVLRGFLITGFPWNLAAYAWTPIPGALPLAAWIGAWGVSFVVVAVSAGIARGVATRRWEPLAFVVLLAAVLLPVAGRWASGGRERGGPGGPSGPMRSAVLVQPNTPNQVGFDAALFESDYARLLALTHEACRPGTLVLWPESAAWPLLYGRDPRLESDLASFAARGCSVLLNSVSEAPGEADERYFNSALLISPGRQPARYDKRHLVPFGEYVPLEPWLRGMIAFFDLPMSNFNRAPEDQPPITLGALRIAAAICYEIVYPNLVATSARDANLLVTVSNDTWFGASIGPHQHLQMARLRAIETGKPVLRATNDGITAAVDSRGRVTASLPQFAPGILRTSVLPRTGSTPFSTHGSTPVVLFCLVLLAGALAPWQRRGALR